MRVVIMAMALIAAGMFCAPGYAEEQEAKSQYLDEIVVTGTRTERNTEDVPSGVSVVLRDDIKNTRMFGIKEALSGISGIQAESRNGGYDARLIIRGAGLKARYGVREIMVLLDGVPITDPDGMTRLDFVDTQLVDRIDIVKGPGSTLYGANAAGGVINIITKSPFEGIKSIRAGYGSDTTQMYNLIYGSSIGKTYFLVTGSRKSTDSWRKWNEFSTTQGSLKLGHMFDDYTSLEASISYTEADLQLPGALTREQFKKDISQLTSEPWRNSGRYSEIFHTSLKFDKEVGDVKIKPVLYYQTWEHYHPVTGLINDGGADVFGTDIQVDVKHQVASIKGVLTAGVAGQVDKADGDKFTYRDVRTTGTGRILYTLSDHKGDLAESGDDTTTKWGIFMQESLRPSDRWVIDAGVRYDQVRFDIRNDVYREYDYGAGKYLDADEIVRRKKTFDYVSPKVGVVYKLNQAVNLYGTIATGFQTPQSSELSLNADLDPSRTYNYETGMKARFQSGHSIDLSLFYITVKDDIVQTILPGNISSYTNAGESRKKGAELSGRVRIAKGLTAGASYTYSDFTYADFTEPVKGKNYDRSGNRFPYIPKNQYAVFAAYRHASGFKCKVDASSWGSYYVDNENSEKYGGYDFITSALIGYERKNLDITVDVNNLFDRRYAMEVTKDSQGVLRYRPGAPLTWMARVTYSF